MWNPLQYYKQQAQYRQEHDKQVAEGTRKMKLDILADWQIKHDALEELRKSDKYTDFEKEVLIHIRSQELAKSLELLAKVNIYF